MGTDTADDPIIPRILPAGYDGFAVQFAQTFSPRANRAALALREALMAADIPGLQECSSALVSTYLRFDPLTCPHETMRAALEDILAQHDWAAAQAVKARRLWRIPACFGGESGPALEAISEQTGLSDAAAQRDLTQTRLTVQAIGFAPGMPYLGALPPAWDIPRQSSLSHNTPAGAICLALRQLVLFPVGTSTGWHHIGQTALRLFRPDTGTPFLLAPGDEVIFEQVSADTLSALRDDPNGGARICDPNEAPK